MPCQFGDSPMSLDKKNYITGKQKRQVLFLNFLNFFINIYKIPNSTICREGGGSETPLVFENKDPQLSIQARLHCLVLAAVHKVLKKQHLSTGRTRST